MRLPPAATPVVDPTSGSTERSGECPPAGTEAPEESRADRISDLPDTILGEIIFLIPTKDGCRTQVLASRWRTLWHAAPLNIDCRRLFVVHDFELHGAIISSHQGSVQCLCIPACCLLHIPFTVNAWLTSRQFKKLQHLEFYHYYGNSCPPSVVAVPSPPVSISWFSSSLHTTTLAQCYLPDCLVDDTGPGWWCGERRKTMRWTLVVRAQLQCLVDSYLHSNGRTQDAGIFRIDGMSARRPPCRVCAAGNMLGCIGIEWSPGGRR
jgi:hypothetical protein